MHEKHTAQLSLAQARCSRVFAVLFSIVVTAILNRTEKHERKEQDKTA